VLLITTRIVVVFSDVFSLDFDCFQICSERQHPMTHLGFAAEHSIVGRDQLLNVTFHPGYASHYSDNFGLEDRSSIASGNLAHALACSVAAE
jgi:hypothetical protein